MIKIKLPTPERIFAPDVMLDTDQGPMKNRELPEDSQVTGEILLATNAQRGEYLGSYITVNRGSERKAFTRFQYDRCVKKHVEKIRNLETHGITDGRSLVDHPPHPVLNDLIQEFFLKICGVHDDDARGDGDAGEISEGESSASE